MTPTAACYTVYISSVAVLNSPLDAIDAMLPDAYPAGILTFTIMKKKHRISCLCKYIYTRDAVCRA